MSNLNSRPTDDATLVLGGLLLVAALVAFISMGPVAIFGAAIPWLIAWATGRSSNALAQLLFGLVALAALIVLGHFMPALYAGYAVISSADDVVQGWIGLTYRTDIAPSAVVLGLAIGSGARLFLQDHCNSSPYTDEKLPSPAPIARIRSKLTASSSKAYDEGSALGIDPETGKDVVLSDRDANHHVLIVGATGSGKTVTGSNIIVSHLQRGYPVVFLDGKGDIDLGRRLKAYAEQLGRPAFLFHHELGGKLDDACAYNPVSAGDFTALANLITSLRPYTEPYYEVLQKGYMQTAVKVAMAIGEPLDLLTLGNLLSVNAMTAAIRKNKHRIPNAQALLLEVQGQRAAEEAGVESLIGTIKNLTQSSLAPLFDTRGGRPVLTLSEARGYGAFAYFSLPALAHGDFSKDLGQLVINDIRLTLARGRESLLIVLDELSTYSGKQILSLVNQGRGFEARVVLLGQSFADLESVEGIDGKAFRNQILASINTVIVHRLNSPDDAELAAQIAGTYAKPEMTAQTVGNKPTGAGSVRMTREFLVGPDRFKRLQRGQAIILSKFGKHVRTIKARLPKFMN
ncbi:type IV secretory system conjugative DNA transfer family protein [Devosia faecipullorum]|uniref:type IV secretory system conjugative DNA transfer family protein n=1 Tax=Devosia faecipullorum TaxID=2755039 RepID=UPI00187B5A74|nr:helicase HerA-like domain-containing protein [Devosia faecipullorum]MBE7734631.1 DUF853 family protein [Devosia faecipullorum]